MASGTLFSGATKRLCIWRISYWHPDAPLILCPNDYVQAEYDFPPAFPALRKFLDFWTRNIEGKLAGVEVDVVGGVKPVRFSLPSAVYSLN